MSTTISPAFSAAPVQQLLGNGYHKHEYQHGELQIMVPMTGAQPYHNLSNSDVTLATDHERLTRLRQIASGYPGQDLIQPAQLQVAEPKLSDGAPSHASNLSLCTNRQRNVDRLIRQLHKHSREHLVSQWIERICPDKHKPFPIDPDKRSIRIPLWWPSTESCRYRFVGHVRIDEVILLLTHLLRLRPTSKDLQRWSQQSMQRELELPGGSWTRFLRQVPLGLIIEKDAPIIEELYIAAAAEEDEEARLSTTEPNTPSEHGAHLPASMCAVERLPPAEGSQMLRSATEAPPHVFPGFQTHAMAGAVSQTHQSYAHRTYSDDPSRTPYLGYTGQIDMIHTHDQDVTHASLETGATYANIGITPLLQDPQTRGKSDAPLHALGSTSIESQRVHNLPQGWACIGGCCSGPPRLPMSTASILTKSFYDQVPGNENY